MLLYLGAGTIAYARARRELMTQASVSWPTFWAMCIAFVGCGAATLIAAYMGDWPLSISRGMAVALGAIVALFGLGLHVAARAQFTFRRAWGLDVDRLVTTGVYRWTRNPQLLGWFCIYAGVGFIGRSGEAILLAVIFVLGCIPWIKLEERVLQRQFGEAFREYCRKTPRLL